MMLMEEAERIAREEHGSSKLAVISGETGTQQQVNTGLAGQVSQVNLEDNSSTSLHQSKRKR